VHDVRHAVVDECHDVARLLLSVVDGQLRHRLRIGLRIDADLVGRVPVLVVDREARPLGRDAGRDREAVLA
jgi:hypothetical protein